MRKILLLFLVLSSLVVRAQTEQGRMLVGLSSVLGLSGAQSNILLLTTDGVAVQPQIGYFVMNNTALGFNFYVTKLRDYAAYGTGLFTRYYILPKTVLPFVQVGIAKGRSNEGNEVRGRYSVFTVFHASLGLAIPVNSKACFDIQLSSNRLKYDNENEGTDFSVGLQIGLSLLLGNSNDNSTTTIQN